MDHKRLALSAALVAAGGLFSGSNFLGLVALSMVSLSLSLQGYTLSGTFLGVYNSNDLTVKFEKTSGSSFPYKFIVKLYEPRDFTDFYYEYDPGQVGFSKYLVKVVTKAGCCYKREVPTLKTPVRGVAGLKERIIPPGVQNYRRGSDKSSYIKYIEFIFYLDKGDTENFPKFKNVAKLGNFVMVGGSAVTKKPEGSGGNWFKFSPSY